MEAQGSDPSGRAGSLAGRVSLITGGAGDLGLAIATSLATAGSRVILADIDSARASKAGADFSARGYDVSALELDVSREESVSAAFETVARNFGTLDVLVNNAGIAARKQSVDLAVEDWNRVLGANLTGTFLCSRAAARLMMAGEGGAIVNVASIMGLVGNSLYANPAYHASKGGIINLTRAHAAEWARHGIRVNAVAPTFAETSLTNRLLELPGIREGIISRTPMGRLARAEEIASVVCFLASDAASFVTGVVMPVDGGWTAI